MKRITKIALFVVAGGLLLSRKASAMTDLGNVEVKSLSMSDSRWAKKTVGASAELVEDVGCMITALVAACNALKGRTMGVDQGINIAMANGGFSGVLLVLQAAAKALGCSAPDKDRLRNLRNVQQLKDRLDVTLKKGGVALVHVDYDLSTPLSNHFIVCFKRTPQGYLCMDPAGGVFITLNADLFVQRTAKRAYTATGVAPVFAVPTAL